MRIGSNGGYGAIAAYPYNYSIQNESSVSAVYAESLEKTGSGKASEGIDAVSPVRYPNAQLQTGPVDPVKRMQHARKTNQEYNQVASGFQGNSTWYGANAVAGGYSMVGGTIDLFA